VLNALEKIRCSGFFPLCCNFSFNHTKSLLHFFVKIPSSSLDFHKNGRSEARQPQAVLNAPEAYKPP